MFLDTVPKLTEVFLYVTPHLHTCTLSPHTFPLGSRLLADHCHNWTPDIILVNS